MIIQTQFLTKPYANANKSYEADDTDDNDNDGNYDRDDTVDDDANKNKLILSAAHQNQYQKIDWKKGSCFWSVIIKFLIFYLSKIWFSAGIAEGTLLLAGTIDQYSLSSEQNTITTNTK